MTKVKLIERKIIESEADIDYPIYLYFQDELCHDELAMINEHVQITVKYSNSGLEIKKERTRGIVEYYLKQQTTKKHFDEVFKEALDNVMKCV